MSCSDVFPKTSDSLSLDAGWQEHAALLSNFFSDFPPMIISIPFLPDAAGLSEETWLNAAMHADPQRTDPPTMTASETQAPLWMSGPGEALKLARTAGRPGVHARGQRMWMTDEGDISLLALRNGEFSHAAS